MMPDKEEQSDNFFYATINGEKVKIEIPEEGALGLLAYGAVGLKAWRKVRMEAKKRRDALNNNKTAESIE